jgi:ABC-type antimicrobial peptide transport system permease subunit
MDAWSLADRAFALAGVAAAVGAAVAASTVRPRAARALVEVAAVTLAVSLVALAIGVGATDLLVDVPADTLARMVTVMGLLGVRNLLAATDAPETRALVSRIAVPLLVPACSLTAVALWAWLGWPASDPTQWAVVVPVAVVLACVGGLVAAWRVRRLTAADDDRTDAVARAIADRSAD